MQHFKSNGKLLLTAEYLVLDGAKALALPTKLGQSLTVDANDSNHLQWKSYDEANQLWYEDQFFIDKIKIAKHDASNPISERLLQIFNAVLELNPNALEEHKGYSFTTQQDFNRFWGLGTSSTLINNMAQWAKIDAYALLEKTFGGSGYDIACAQQRSAILYQRTNTKPLVSNVDFNPVFKNHLYFVYLNKKQNSREGIAKYKAHKGDLSHSIDAINAITQSIITCNSLADFKTLISTHEVIISKVIDQKPVKDLLFNDFDGAIKSLGAWGGDFILVASDINPEAYFISKGYSTVIPYSQFI
ncbi:GYDIA family GHMP kinase [Winogradskyella immobilis]|uniref:GHMP kinase n=1 Tax=Winogradskyella immobilis TaxID=2816852 RepID=A0ABS8EJ86_9FLAO|nr:GYDIA family GHMP kinase [Winogradskyella immobilis]MCC1483180.1 GHMP kinase [Winogradskyella immobilis]MCG0015275.1 GHMP kinase [Winogradskyella immobilis]